MGRLQAATATSDAIRKWCPRYVLLVGIAGGVAQKNVELGDILISTQIVDYELQKLTPAGPEMRWEVHRADPRLLGAARNLSKDWQELTKVNRPGSGQPKRHVGPIASGDKVIAFREVMKKHRDAWPALIGVEMEAAGVVTAAFQSTEPPGFFMVRGVSDFADEKKGVHSTGQWRLYACDVAASFAIALLKSGPIPLPLDIAPLPVNGARLYDNIGSPTSRNSSEKPQETSLESRILDALLLRFTSKPGSPIMTLSELHEAIGIHRSDKEKTWYTFYSMQGKELIDPPPVWWTGS
jgi:nucleoside phosphorylase